MGKIITTKLNRWDGGMKNDIREETVSGCRLCRNFDALTFPKRLVPYRSSESGNDTLSRKIQMFCYVNSSLFAAGNPSSTTTIYYRNTFTDGSWSTTANNVTDVGAGESLYNGFMVYYAAAAKILVSTGTVDVGGYDPGGSAIWKTMTVGVLSSGTAALVHSKDDIFYMSYYHSTAGARIAKYDASLGDVNNAGAWTIPALTIGLRYVVTSMCEYGDYIAIACRQRDQLNGPSRVFIWDRNDSLTTLTESIDFGLGDIRVIDFVNGELLGISLLNETTVIEKTQLVARSWSGGASAAIEVARLDGTTSGNPTVLSHHKFRKDNRLYFLHSGYYDGVYQAGLWSIARRTPSDPFIFNFERPSNNDTDSSSLEGFGFAGDYCFIAYNNDGSVSKTNDSATAYTATSIRETTKRFKDVSSSPEIDDVSLKKKLIGVTATFTPLASGATVVLKYKKDADTSWTQIFSFASADEVSHSAINIESSGVNLPHFKEIQFRLESTGGAEITGLEFQSEVTDKDKPYG